MNNGDAPLLVPALEHATHALALWVERTFQRQRLTQAEAHVLAYLARHSPCSINDLHHSFGHKRSTLTSLLDRLEGRGLVQRAAHPSDRRLVMVQLTDAGRQAGVEVSEALHDLEGRVLARTGSGDTAAFLRVLQALEEELT